ncbi:acyl-CoA dehydrogenase [Actinomadura sp. KC06]|uniref:acyl-CoA dehydrogenase family protein n=1 Tax=Actinomadura sp. KC06 TaxID=2530369 RepID=UPI001047C16C|nr:acyl-CoA dehydrogenase family protein [Actinomadura sp. KC06]TDD38369.1 acyl-CoA dehydrogenase [Actinomadura sp. KC06]
MVLALLNDEQQMLREMMSSLAGSVSAGNPRDIGEIDRAKGWGALAGAGMLGLRVRDGSGAPTGSGVDAMIVAEALGGALAPLPYVGSAVLATELLALAGAPPDLLQRAADGTERHTVLLIPDLSGIATVAGLGTAIAFDCWGAGHALALSDGGPAPRLVRVPLGDAADRGPAADLTREIARFTAAPAAADAEEIGRPLEPADLSRWRALALTVIAADAVGAMRAALDGVVAYSKERVAYGTLIGSFQAIQHMCADALVHCEAASACVSYAAWAADEADPDEALLAAHTAKAYTAIASLDVAETVMQVYGGIGHTWEHVAHLYARRVLLDREVLGDAAHSLLSVADLRLGQRPRPEEG